VKSLVQPNGPRLSRGPLLPAPNNFRPKPSEILNEAILILIHL